MELGDRVKLKREALGMTQEELAIKMGYKSRTSVNKIELGRPVGQKIIIKLSEALGVSIPYLMGWEDTRDEEMRRARLDYLISVDANIPIVIERYSALPEDKKETISKMVEDYYNAFANGKNKD